MKNPNSPLVAIRKHCLSCEDGWSGVRDCIIPDCFLYPFRFGKNPRIKGKKGRKINEKAKEGLKKWQENQKVQKSLGYTNKK